VLCLCFQSGPQRPLTDNAMAAHERHNGPATVAWDQSSAFSAASAFAAVTAGRGAAASSSSHSAAAAAAAAPAPAPTAASALVAVTAPTTTTTTTAAAAAAAETSLAIPSSASSAPVPYGFGGGVAVKEDHHRPTAAGAGALVDHPQLTQLSALLKAIDAGDRIVKGRLELFSCSRRNLTQRALQEILERSPESWTSSSLGPLSQEQSQLLLANLRALLSLLFADYDSSNIFPEHFERCTDKHMVVASINNGLAAVVDRVHSGFLGEFWREVQEAFDIVNCEVFAFRPTIGTFGPVDKSLMSFHYFFIDLYRGRILFIGCVTKSRGAAQGGIDSDSDVVLSNQSGTDSSSRRGGDSDISLQEGELIFSEASDNDGMMD